MNIFEDLSKNVEDHTCNHKCSKCGICCGLIIPFTEKELTTIKKYVRDNNIEPQNRINPMTGMFESRCCFYDAKNKICTIYEVRPYVCRDFKCDHKDWRERRNNYEKRAKYNNCFSKDNLILATFDDKIFDDYSPILRLISQVSLDYTGEVESDVLIYLLKSMHRLDILNYVKFTDTKGNEIEGKNLI